VVDPKALLDEPELLARCVVGAVRALRLRIEVLELRENALSLRALRADLVRVGTRCRGPEKACNKQADQKCRQRD